MFDLPPHSFDMMALVVKPSDRGDRRKAMASTPQSHSELH